MQLVGGKDPINYFGWGSAISFWWCRISAINSIDQVTGVCWVLSDGNFPKSWYHDEIDQKSHHYIDHDLVLKAYDLGVPHDLGKPDF